MFRLPRSLDPTEQRVLGALLEKEQTTPDLYPLTVKSLLAACNQSTGRDPVMSLGESEVLDALERMTPDVFVWRVEGPRADRWKHGVDRRWELDGATKAVIALLLLRGPQTLGELRGRAERMHRFGSVGEVQEAVRRLAAGNTPLVEQLPRLAGQKETRWAHRLGEAIQPAGARPPAPPPVEAARPPQADDVTARVQRLESRVEELAAALEALRASLGE